MITTAYMSMPELNWLSVVFSIFSILGALSAYVASGDLRIVPGFQFVREKEELQDRLSARFCESCNEI